MSYVNNMSAYVDYVSYMSYVSHISIFMNRLKSLVFVFKKCGIFLLIYKDGKHKL